LLLGPARHVVIEADKEFSRVDFLPSPQTDTDALAFASVSVSVEDGLTT